MKIISHRGYWIKPIEKNTDIAFFRSLKHGFGIETDLRDSNGEIVVSHDMPEGGELRFNRLISHIICDFQTLALNIKSDGLANIISKEMMYYPRDNWFVFDMSIPDMINHLRAGNPVFARMSEYEQQLPFPDQITGVWLDSFKNDWFSLNLIEELINKGMQVCVVSPELHGRDHACLWRKILPIANSKNLMICTDFPVDANSFFNDK
jgi:hypothetical protein